VIGGIVRASMRFRLLVLAAAAILLIVGTAQVRKAPVDVLPEFTAPVVNIQVESLGLSADEVEQLITVPLEQDILNGVRGARAIRSDSVPGLSHIDLRFDHGENLLEARQLTQERLTQAGVGLPNVSRPAQMLDPISSTGHAMIVGLSTQRLSPIELSVLARWTIRPRLRGLEGVANVAIWGFRDRQLQVLVDPERLKRENLTVQQIMRTTGNSQLVSPLTFLEASTPGTGGFIDGPNQRLSVRHVLPFGTPRDLGDVPVDGRPGLRLGDVARVVEAHQEPLIGDAVVHGGPGLLLVIDKTPGANTLDVTRRVDDALSELQQGMPGVAVDRKVFRPASFIDSAIDNVALILAIAALLVLLALVALLRRWHAVLVSVISIPLALVAALLAVALAPAATAAAATKHHRVPAKCEKRSYRVHHRRRCRRPRSARPAPTSAPVTTLTQPPAAPAVTDPPPADTGPTTPTTSYARLGVSAREFSLTLSRTELASGAAIVELVNYGEDPHDLRIARADGGGTPVDFPETASRERSSRTVTLAPGSYTLLCTLPGHAQAGMRATLTVAGG
jgi:Cu/Ag efflux pump CusA